LQPAQHGVDAVEIRPVASRRDVEPFWRAALVAQGDDPAFTPLLLKETYEVLTPGCTPFARENDGMAWTAFRAGHPVGRIYAVRSEAHLARHNDGTGQFGFVEGIDDDAVWDALFATVYAFARDRGLTRLRGPFSASINHECGLMVQGHGARATTHTNYAPPYYARQLERLGFAAVKDIVGYEGSLSESRLPARVAAIRRKWSGSPELTLRPAQGAAAVAELNAVYNDAWADNWGSVPVSDAEASFLAGLAQQILPPDWSTLIDWKGQAIGALVMAPDLNEAVRDLKGRLVPFGWAKLLWRLKVSGVSRVRVPVIGVRRGWRGTRVGAMAAATLLADAVEKARKAGCSRLEVSWMLEDNRPIINLVRSMPAAQTKVWRIFEKAL
jgi:GNAT superfamily N-acetyltransferase